MEQDRRAMDILERIERGEIAAVEGLRLLESLAQEPAEAPAPMASPAGEDSILDRIARGEITAQDALRQLGAAPGALEAGLSAAPTEPPAEAIAAALPAPDEAPAAPAAAQLVAPPLPERGGQEAAPPPPMPDIEGWKRWWQIPLAIGVALIVLGSGLMASAVQASGIGFGFLCATLPLALGVVLAAAAWGSRSARWLHVRIRTGQASWPRAIAISIPIPIRLTAWALRTFRPDIPPLRGTSLDELILALESTSADAPLYVEVDEGGGERVQVFIG